LVGEAVLPALCALSLPGDPAVPPCSLTFALSRGGREQRSMSVSYQFLFYVRHCTFPFR
jgi:hypothetical protein